MNMTVLAGGWRAAALAAAVVCAGCGGGDGGGGGRGRGGSSSSGSAACDVASQNVWLHDYMADWYYWAGSSPIPDPGGYASVASYFEALRYPGDAVVPRDHWSYYQDSAAYNQFFVEGKTMGYGVSVNGIELTLPLKVRYVDPLSPAAAAGLKRGDVIASINGRSSADIIAANDFAMLVAAKAGDVLTLAIQGGASTTTVNLVAATYDLVPVTGARVLTLSTGGKAGYVSLKDFVPVAETPLTDAIASFRTAGATDIIIDLRYDGGGRISTATLLASLVAGASNNGKLFSTLKYNAKHQASNIVFNLAGGTGTAFSRAIVITGSRTCSASELLVNGLKPYMPVVTLGGATCGKPFGFSPAESCGTTFSAVNFEAFNSLGDGRYYAGIAPSCTLSDDFSGELGDPAEKLTAGAVTYLQTGACPAGTVQAMSAKPPARVGIEPGEHRGMFTN